MKQSTPTTYPANDQMITEIKILISGPVSAGKTTAVSRVCDSEIVTTEAAYTGRCLDDDKDTTTVAMDYGLCSRFPGHRIHLYGTPGQQRFDFMWDILRKGMDGIIILINNDQPTPHETLKRFLATFSSLPTVIGVTKMDKDPEPSIGDYRKMLQKLDASHIPVFNIDSRSRRDVTLLIDNLLPSVDEQRQ